MEITEDWISELEGRFTEIQFEQQREKNVFIKKRALGTDKIRKESNINVIIVPGKENEYSD